MVVHRWIITNGSTTDCFQHTEISRAVKTAKINHNAAWVTALKVDRELASGAQTRPSARNEYLMNACNDPVLSETCTQIRWYLNEATWLTYGAAAAQIIAADNKTAPTPLFQPLRRTTKTKANGVRTSAAYLI